MTRPDAETAEALRALSAAYAAGVDRRDVDLLRSAFHADAILTVHNRYGLDAEREQRLAGISTIETIVRVIARYPITFHFLGQARYELGEGPTAGTATGEVYCEAHHHQVGGDGPDLDHILYLRYLDHYRLDPDDGWRITARTVEVDWSEDRPLPNVGERAVGARAAPPDRS